MDLKSKKVCVQKSDKELFEMLLNLNNYKKLMPDAKGFEVIDEKTFLFTLQGIPELRLKILESLSFFGNCIDKF